MRRPLFLAAVLLMLDQVTKVLAQALFAERSLYLLPGLRLTYCINPGIWLNSRLPPAYLTWLQALSAGCMLLGGLYLAFYHRFYRRSLLADMGYASFVAAALGNLFLDRWLAGGARDFMGTPWFVFNVADLLSSLSIWLLVLEVLLFGRARERLVPMRTPREMGRELRFFWRLARHEVWHWRRGQ